MNNYAAHPDYPSWFLFADDDYFVRTYKLWGILSNLNPALPYGIQPTPNNANGMVSAGNHMVHRITDWAMWFGNHNCSIPCTSGSSVSSFVCLVFILIFECFYNVVLALSKCMYKCMCCLLKFSYSSLSYHITVVLFFNFS